MTRDEARTACIEAIGEAIYEITGARYSPEAIAFVFDAQHGLALVCPIEATEEMLNEASINEPYRAFTAWAFKTMSATGDLTNSPEKKP